MAKFSDIYERTLRVLDEHGWHQGGMQGADGSLCVMGAVEAAFVNMHYPNPLHEAAAAINHLDYFVPCMLNHDDPNGKDFGHRCSVRFNDDPHTTEEDVRLLLKKAIVDDV